MPLAPNLVSAFQRVGFEFKRTVASLRAHENLTGGGTVTVTANGAIRWSQRFIVISNGNGSHFAGSGYFDIAMPANGASISGVGGAAARTVDANGIALADWEALYYVLPIGGTSASADTAFRVATYSGGLVIPDNWVLLALRNGDGSGVRLGIGRTVALGSSTSATSPFPMYSPTGHTHTRADITNLGSAAALDQPAVNTNAALSQVVRGDDTRLTDARTPTAHTHTKSQITDFAHTHPSGDITGLGTAATRNVGTGSGTVAAGDDARLSDTRTPTDLSVTFAKFAAAAIAASGESSTTKIVRADDARLSDARTPTAHAHSAADITSGTLANARLIAALAYLGSLTPAADKLPYYSSASAAALADFTAYGRSLVAAASASAARTALDVYSRAEVDSAIVPGAEVGFVRQTSNQTVAANTTIGGTAGYIPGFTVTVTGDGRPVVVRVTLGGVTHASGLPTYVYLNMNDVMVQAEGKPSVSTGVPTPQWEFTVRLDPLTSGTSYRFNVGVARVGGSGGYTTVAASNVPAEIHVTRC